MKKAFFMAAFAVVAATGGYMGYRAQFDRVDNHSSLTIANVEALSQGDIILPNDRYGYVLTKVFKTDTIFGDNSNKIPIGECCFRGAFYELCNAAFVWGNCEQ